MEALRLGSAEVRFTGRDDGDFSSSAGAMRLARQAAVTDRVWRTAKQVHGARAVLVDAGTDIVGEADALVTTDARVALAVRTADCAPVALAAPGVVAVAHAGWRGLRAGVLREVVALMKRTGATTIEAVVGPCIQPECYEFGAELDDLVEHFGPEVRGRTTDGRPALDLVAGIRSELAASGVELMERDVPCTACQPGWWSHRARGEGERQSTVVWLA